MWKLQIASMKGRHVNARNIKEEDFNRPVEDFTPENAEIISVKMYVVKVPKMKKNKVTVSVVLPVFNKSDFSDSSRIDIKKLRRVLHKNPSAGKRSICHLREIDLTPFPEVISACFSLGKSANFKSLSSQTFPKEPIFQKGSVGRFPEGWICMQHPPGMRRSS